MSDSNMYRVGSKVSVNYFFLEGDFKAKRVDSATSGNIVIGRVTGIATIEADEGDVRNIVSVKMPDGSTMDYLQNYFEDEVLVAVANY